MVYKSNHLAVVLLLLGLILLAPSTHAEDASKPDDPAVFCARTWPDDFVMQKHCITKQREAIRKIAETFNRLVKQEKRIDEPLYSRILGKCTKEMGPDDAAMIEHCTRKQIEAYFSLKQDQP